MGENCSFRKYYKEILTTGVAVKVNAREPTDTRQCSFFFTSHEPRVSR